MLQLRRLLSIATLFTLVACGGTSLNNRKDNPPVVSAGEDQQAQPNQSLTFQGQATPDTGRTIVAWEWNFGDNATAATQKATHSYAAVGTYHVKLTATDDLGTSGSATITVTVSGQPRPTLTAVISGPTSGNVGDMLMFDGSMSSPANVINGWHWDFGDGTKGTGETASHAYTTAGTYQVKLMVTDAEGDSAISDPWMVEIMGPPPAMLPANSNWTYSPNNPNDMGCGGFGTGPLTMTVSGTSMTITEGGGLGSTTYTGTYDPSTRMFSVSNSGGGETQGFNCTFSSDYRQFTGNYFVNVSFLGCSAMIPVTGTRTSPP